MMTSLEHPSYKDRDRVSVLEKQIDDFKMLTSQQSLTIRRLQEEGISKADRITELLSGGARDTRGSMTAVEFQATVHLVRRGYSDFHQ